ncbi:hypothetical protein Tchar_02662 [Tepidimonas charontis]|uniref:Uncharacterized protein n=1 Tax=Tepidimonas charontis TaxID=2267262 RepID=A0A554WYZ1_9BURK|nr:hypothetical protein Tchar_02662 [Tepidimonas charontis]
MAAAGSLCMAPMRQRRRRAGSASTWLAAGRTAAHRCATRSRSSRAGGPGWSRWMARAPRPSSAPGQPTGPCTARPMASGGWVPPSPTSCTIAARPIRSGAGVTTRRAWRYRQTVSCHPASTPARWRGHNGCAANWASQNPLSWCRPCCASCVRGATATPWNPDATAATPPTSSGSIVAPGFASTSPPPSSWRCAPWIFRRASSPATRAASATPSTVCGRSATATPTPGPKCGCPARAGYASTPLPPWLPNVQPAVNGWWHRLPHCSRWPGRWTRTCTPRCGPCGKRPINAGTTGC